jgi:hypothetical protein
MLLVLLVALGFPLSALADDATVVTDPPGTGMTTTEPFTADTTTTAPADTTTTAPAGTTTTAPADTTTTAPADTTTTAPADPGATTTTDTGTTATAPAAPPDEEQPATPAAPPSSSTPTPTTTPPPASTTTPAPPATSPAPVIGVDVPGVGGIEIALPVAPVAAPAPVEVTPILGAPAAPVQRPPVTVIVPTAVPLAPPASPDRAAMPSAAASSSVTDRNAVIPGPVAPPVPDAAAITQKALAALAVSPTTTPFADGQDASVMLSRHATGIGAGPVVGDEHGTSAPQSHINVIAPPAPSASSPFVEKILPAGGVGFGGSSLLAVLASYVLPGGGTMPGSTLFLFLMQLGLLALVAVAPRSRGFERVVALGLLRARPGHEMAVRRPG